MLTDQYLAMVQGPILFTAPHSGKLRRNGGDYARTHLREKFTAVIAMRMADQLYSRPEIKNLGSYCVWATNHQLNEIDQDPNYLIADHVSESPFHRMLHAWASANAGTPLMHVDIHGKMDRKDSYELDLGVSCMYKHWDKDLDF